MLSPLSNETAHVRVGKKPVSLEGARARDAYRAIQIGVGTASRKRFCSQRTAVVEGHRALLVTLVVEQLSSSVRSWQSDTALQTNACGKQRFVSQWKRSEGQGDASPTGRRKAALRARCERWDLLNGLELSA